MSVKAASHWENSAQLVYRFGQLMSTTASNQHDFGGREMWISVKIFLHTDTTVIHFSRLTKSCWLLPVLFNDWPKQSVSWAE